MISELPRAHLSTTRRELSSVRPPNLIFRTVRADCGIGNRKLVSLQRAALAGSGGMPGADADGGGVPTSQAGVSGDANESSALRATWSMPSASLLFSNLMFELAHPSTRPDFKVEAVK